MTDIDPQEWGEAKAHIENTKDTVTDIKAMLRDSIDTNTLAHQRLHERIDDTNTEVGKVKVNIGKLIGGLILLSAILGFLVQKGVI